MRRGSCVTDEFLVGAGFVVNIILLKFYRGNESITIPSYSTATPHAIN
jgi:hypothetical protein